MALGTHPSAGGIVWIGDDPAARFATRGWARFRINDYNLADGQTWVSAGDSDGDGDLEIAIGIGRYPQYGGWVQLIGGLESNFQFLRWLRVPWAQYNSTEGSTRPVFGQVH